MTEATTKGTDTLALQCHTPCSTQKSGDTSGTQMGTFSFHPHSTNNSNFSPSGIHLFCPLTENLDGKRSSGDAKVAHDVQTRLKEQTTAALQMMLLGAVHVQTQLL
jgi:hypothetical protein